MVPTFSWYVPSAGPAGAGDLAELAQRAEQAGWDRILVPCAFGDGDSPCLDAFTLGVLCLRATTRLKVVVSHRPGWIHPAVFSQMCATADELSGRLAVSVVTAGAPGDMEQFGDQLSHDARYERAGEFVDVLRGLWTGGRVTYAGQFYQISRAQLSVPVADSAGPEIYLTGASAAAVTMAAAQADTYMIPASTVEQVREQITEVRRQAAQHGRTPRFCCTATIVTGGTYREPPGQPAGGPSGFGRWSGFVRAAHGRVLAGSYESVADQLCQYTEAGVTSWQLFGFPCLDQAVTVAEHVLPLVRARLNGHASSATAMAGATR